MLSTGNQHKASITTESVRSITLVRKVASRFSGHSIPQHFYSKLALSTALSMGLILTGCGAGSSATTRIESPPPSTATVDKTFDLKVESPVLLNNVKVTVTDTMTGAVLAESTIKNDNDIVFTLPLITLNSSHLILMTLSPIDSSSQYFDPMLNNQLGAMAIFNKPLHTLISANILNKTTRVDPFTEMVYQRALIRSGTLDLNKPRLNMLTESHLNSATNEVGTALGTFSKVPFTIFFNSAAQIAAINLLSKTPATSIIDPQASETLIALAQLALFAENNPTTQTPYLDFAARGSLDLLDGDLDGMTIFGADTAGTVQITNPILYSGVTSIPNNDPDHTDLATLILTNALQRNQRGAALKQATTQYFNDLNAGLPLASRTDTASLDHIQTFDFATFTAKYPNLGSGFGFGSSTPLVVNTRIGAGNYTRAFGLPTGIDSEQALDASDASGRSNDILQLNGTYQASNGCQLSIGYDGTIQLSQGAQTYQATVSRKFSDRLIRLFGNHYLLNVTSADITAPRFIQIKTMGAQVISAAAGRSAQQVPMELDTTELSCTF